MSENKNKNKNNTNVSCEKVGHDMHHYASGWNECRRCGITYAPIGYYDSTKDQEDISGMPC